MFDCNNDERRRQFLCVRQVWRRKRYTKERTYHIEKPEYTHCISLSAEVTDEAAADFIFDFLPKNVKDELHQMYSEKTVLSVDKVDDVVLLILTVHARPPKFGVTPLMSTVGEDGIAFILVYHEGEPLDDSEVFPRVQNKAATRCVFAAADVLVRTIGWSTINLSSRCSSIRARRAKRMLLNMNRTGLVLM